MGNILPLTVRKPSKLGFKRVQKRKKSDPEGHGQMNLFKPTSDGAARILSLPSKVTPFEAALGLDERGDHEAAAAYKKAISIGDCVADAYCNLGIIESRAGKPEKAFDCFTKSLQEDSRHLESHYNLGNLYFDMENFRLARQHYEIAAEIEPDFPNIYFNLGLVLAVSEDLAPAIEVLDKYKNLVADEEGRLADELLDSLHRSLSTRSHD